MTREQVEEQARQLQAEQPERHFVVRESADGGWEVASVLVPKELRRPEFTDTISSGPRPSPADDPRTGNERRMPGLPGGL